jgi:hypothetical protein
MILNRQRKLPGTVKGMGIEVGIKARLLWPGDDPRKNCRSSPIASAVFPYAASPGARRQLASAGCSFTDGSLPSAKRRLA